MSEEIPQWVLSRAEELSECNFYGDTSGVGGAFARYIAEHEGDPFAPPRAPSHQPVQRIEGWIAPADLYAAISTLAEQNPDAKHVCWDMLMLAHALPRTFPKHKEAGK